MLNKTFILMAMPMLLAGCNATKPQAQAPVELATFDQKVSYMQGQNLAANFQKYDLTLDPAIVAKAIDDMINKRQSMLSDDQLTSLKEELSKRVKDAKEEEKQQVIASNNTASENFLAENKAKPGIQVTETGLQYKVIQAGTGAKPKATDIVTLNYVGKLTNGTEFENSASKGQGKPVSLHADKLVPGFKEALALMPVGSKWEIYVPANLGYGKVARGKIPPASVLIFEIELIDAKPAPIDSKPSTKSKK